MLQYFYIVFGILKLILLTISNSKHKKLNTNLKEDFSMKKNYISPEAEVVTINIVDATNASDDGVAKFDPSSIDMQ